MSVDYRYIGISKKQLKLVALNFIAETQIL